MAANKKGIHRENGIEVTKKSGGRQSNSEKFQKLQIFKHPNIYTYLCECW